MDTPASTAWPSTASFLAYHAAQTPDRPAILMDGETTTFRRFHDDARRMRDALAELGVAADHTIGLAHSHTYLHWLVILACEALGAISYSYLAGMFDDENAFLDGLDRVLQAPDTPPDTTAPATVIDGDWVHGVLARPPGGPLEPDLLDGTRMLRIISGSGTTGRPQRMYYNASVQAFRLSQQQFRMGFNRRSRYLISTGLHVNTHLIFAIACLRAGGTCVVYRRGEIAANIRTYGITHISCIPADLDRIIQTLPDDYPRPAELTIATAGAPVPAHLRKVVRDRLGGVLMDIYGSTEAAAACAMDAGGTGRVVPGVAVQVVNDRHEPVYGEVGYVRYTGGASVAGYIDDEEATRRMFRDGWFYPGDEGVMVDPHTLHLGGRPVIMINIKGHKVLPRDMEATLKAVLPVKDVCVTALPDPDGDAQLCIAVVLGTESREAVRATLQPIMPADYGPVPMTVVKAIPRDQAGEIKRDAFRAALLRPSDRDGS